MSTKSKKYTQFEDVISHGDYHIFTDGATFNNGRKNSELPSLGGWGYAIFDSNDNQLFEGSGYPEEETTISLMEMEGVIQGLKRIIKEKCTKANYQNPINITITSDSQYVITGITEWIHNWLKRNWKTNDNKPIANKAQWEYISALSGVNCSKVVNITWFKCKSHTGLKHNDIADELASQALVECKKFFGV